MKKSVRNIISFITSTCLVASLGAVSISADEEVVDNAVDVAVANTEAQVTVANTVAQQQVVNTEAQATVANTVAQQQVATTEAQAPVADTEAQEIPKVTNEANVDETNGEAVDTDSTVGEGDVAEGTLATDDENTVVSSVDTDAVVTDENGRPIVTGADDVTVSVSGDTTYITTTATNADVTYTTTKSTTSAFDYGYGYGSPVDVPCDVPVRPAFTTATEKVLDEVQKSFTKDVVLTLDTSNSTAGEPNELIKQTAIDLVNKLISEDPDVQISIVGFDGTAHTLEVGQVDEYNIAVTDEYGNQVVDRYFNDIEFLTQEIEKMLDTDNLGIGTDYMEALNEVKLVLDSGDGIEKSVVIMTDGQNSGLFGDAHTRTGAEINDGETAGDSCFLNAELNDYLQGVVDFANSEIKPFATIYTIGYYQNIEDNPLAVDDSTALLNALASPSSPTQAPTYYEANEENIDEITDLIAQEIVYHAAPDADDATAETTKSNSSATKSNSSSNSSSNASSSDSPKTSDAGVASVVVLAGLAGAMVVITKKKD